MSVRKSIRKECTSRAKCGLSNSERANNVSWGHRTACPSSLCAKERCRHENYKRKRQQDPGLSTSAQQEPEQAWSHGGTAILIVLTWGTRSELGELLHSS